MFANYIKTAIRTLLRSRLFTLINVFSLALGVTASLLLYLYIQNEFGYNKSFPTSNRAYRVVTERIESEGSRSFNTQSTTMLAKTIRGQIPGIEVMTQVSGPTDASVRQGTFAHDASLMAVEPGFFKVFGLDPIKGDAAAALNGTRSVVVTRSFAEEHLTDGAMGAELEIQIGSEFVTFQVAGVVDDPPTKSTLQFEILYPFEVIYQIMRTKFQEQWGMSWSTLYVLLEQDAVPAEVETSIQRVVEQLVVGLDEIDVVVRWALQPVDEIHLSISNSHNLPTEVNSTPLLILALITIVIVIIACINFTTLSVGRSTTRAKEVGIRKVMGASRLPLVIQFWAETGAIALLSLLLGVLLSELFLPAFNQLVNRELVLQVDGGLFLALGVIWLVLVFTAGSYPAFVMSRFSPVNAFRGGVQVGGRGRLRKSLVFIQFCISISLVALTLIMSRQINYLLRQNLGFDASVIVELSAQNRDNTGERIVERLQAEIGGDPNVESISGVACSLKNRWFLFSWEEPDGRKWEDLNANVVMPGYLETMGLDLLSGRDFQPGNERDRKGRTAIVNQTFAESMGWDDPVGQVLPGSFADPVEVIGVVSDFHFASLHNEIKPLMLLGSVYGVMSHKGGVGMSAVNWFTVQNALVRLSPDNIPRSLDRLEQAWNDAAPDYTFNPVFVDETVRSYYEEERRWNRVIQSSAVTAIVIAILGLFGLSTLEVEQRRKEIGIRKVLGATVPGLIILLGRNITMLVAGAAILALPSAILLGQRWLESFAFRISISPLTLAAAVLLALGVSWLTVGSLAWRAANRNPVHSIRHE
jgi:putative ABC transport system permease protein